MKLRLALLTITFAICFSEAKAIGPSFSCKPTHKLSSVETMICQSPALSDVDRLLRNAYGKALSKQAPSQKMRFMKTQEAWLKDRALCSDHDCIHTSIMNRLTEIDRLIKQ